MRKYVAELEREFKKASDSYTLSLMANVFINVDNKAMANEVGYAYTVPNAHSQDRF